MLATATDKPFNSDEWLFELKLDGYRAVAEMSKQNFLLYSRNGLDLGLVYPAVAAALKKMNIDTVLDGEIVVLDKDGKADFQELQNYTSGSNLPVVYYVFDILSLKNHDLTDLPLLERKKFLKKVLKRSSVIRYCDHILNDGIEFYNEVKKNNLEGIIAKRRIVFIIPVCGQKNG